MARKPAQLGITLLALLATACANIAPSVEPASGGSAAAIPSGRHTVSSSAKPSTKPAPSNLQTLSQAPAPSATPGAATRWTGPVRTDFGPVLVDGMSWRNGQGWYEWDGEDTRLRYVDITEVRMNSDTQPNWHLVLAHAPPMATEIDPSETVISYGLTFDRDGDGVADYVVGISNEAPVAGEFRVWVSDLVTGEGQEQVGGPYGYPVEFHHPDEGSVIDPGLPSMVFTFLLGSRPEGIDHKTRFYAWASLTVDGEVRAWDYAPHIGWLSSSRPNQ